MSWVGRSMALVAATAVSVVGCASGSGSDDGGGSASCVFQIRYQGRTYQDVAHVEFTVGKKLGAAVKPPCDDTGGQDDSGEAATTQTAYEVDGVAPEMAIAVGDTPGEAKFVASYSGSELPPEVKKLIHGS
ncbi:DUF6281 family protein [Streptomyces sp. NPDC007070]|uniref:DUF6281 family protein n=1 Tax=Streptomyces sp. NPDC007070 TaxID=3154312 RepID=UPI0033F68211